MIDLYSTKQNLLNFSISSGFLGTLYILFLTALLGIGDGVLLTQLNALLGMLFKHEMKHEMLLIKPSKPSEQLCLPEIFSNIGWTLELQIQQELQSLLKWALDQWLY
ncbi:unnamed protein product [Vicia faba]|uniref:Uncharacterized protein n=1 Tax=Vicia faba TaxID=3906 RepID=A0AAV1ANQ8_VICFA|nr:unnamed protein product [Vicia faba]